MHKNLIKNLDQIGYPISDVANNSVFRIPLLRSEQLHTYFLHTVSLDLPYEVASTVRKVSKSRELLKRTSGLRRIFYRTVHGTELLTVQCGRVGNLPFFLEVYGL